VGKFASKIRLMTVGSLVLPSLACAAGLGKLSVLSSLGQPLKAEIEIVSLQKGEGDGIAARLASGEAFRQASIELNPALLSVKFGVERRTGGRFVMTLASTQAVNEPFIDMLVELNWANGRLVREYTFLLDPPEYAGPSKAEPVQAAQPAQVAPLVIAAPTLPPSAEAVKPTQTAGTEPASPAQTVTPAPVAPVQTAPEPAVEAQAAPAGGSEPVAVAQVAPQDPPQAQAAAPADAPASASVQVESVPATTAPTTALIEEPGVSQTYEVRRGDTLSKIALRNKIEGVTLQQMLVAMFRANQDAFVGDNMNRLRAGRILNIPDKDAAATVTNADARRIVFCAIHRLQRVQT